VFFPDRERKLVEQGNRLLDAYIKDLRDRYSREDVKIRDALRDKVLGELDRAAGKNWGQLSASVQASIRAGLKAPQFAYLGDLTGLLDDATVLSDAIGINMLCSEPDLAYLMIPIMP
jgi:hypothetical protein